MQNPISDTHFFCGGSFLNFLILDFWLFCVSARTNREIRSFPMKSYMDYNIQTFICNFNIEWTSAWIQIQFFFSSIKSKNSTIQERIKLIKPQCIPRRMLKDRNTSFFASTIKNVRNRHRRRCVTPDCHGQRCVVTLNPRLWCCRWWKKVLAIKWIQEKRNLPQSFEVPRGP
jgi:hypothetical protein